MDSNVNNIENKKNTKLIVMIIIILVVLVLGSFAVYKLVLSDDSEQSKESNNSSTVIDKENGGDVDTEVDVEDETEPEVETEPDADNEKEDNKDKEFKFETAYGEVKINATKALAGRGTAGSSNTIFYIKYNNLYLYVHMDDDVLCATDVADIYYETEMSEQISVKLKSSSKIVEKADYLDYIK